MFKKRLISISLVVTLLIGAKIMISDHLAMAHTLMVTANYTKESPEGIDDPVWREAQAVQLLVEGREKSTGDNGTVSTWSLYTDDSLYFLFKWKLSTKTVTEKGDLWHWKAARSAPYNYADDAWLTVAGSPTGSYRETGRRKDAGTGGDLKNQTEDGTRPLYMQDPLKKPSVQEILLLEEATKITDYSIFKAGDKIPFRLPIRPSGSRFDVKSISRYANGGWMVMLYRKLDTGHEDDVVFNHMKNYGFALAIFDDSGSDHSKTTEPMTLSFTRK